MADCKRKRPRRTGDKHIKGVERIDVLPEVIVRALFKRPISKTKKERE